MTEEEKNIQEEKDYEDLLADVSRLQQDPNHTKEEHLACIQKMYSFISDGNKEAMKICDTIYMDHAGLDAVKLFGMCIGMRIRGDAFVEVYHLYGDSPQKMFEHVIGKIQAYQHKKQADQSTPPEPEMTDEDREVEALEEEYKQLMEHEQISDEAFENYRKKLQTFLAQGNNEAMIICEKIYQDTDVNTSGEMFWLCLTNRVRGKLLVRMYNVCECKAENMVMLLNICEGMAQETIVIGLGLNK